MREVRINNRWPLLLPDHLADLPHWAWWEHQRLGAMYAAIRTGDVVWEIGAEQGEQGALYAQWARGCSDRMCPCRDGRPCRYENNADAAPPGWRRGGICLFEPVLSAWPCIRQTFEENGIQPPLLSWSGFVGVDDRSLHETWVQGWPPAASDDLIPNPGFANRLERPDLPEIRMDSVTRELTPDVISIDVEGAEYEVLMSGERLLRETAPIVFVSVHPEMLRTDYNRTPDDLLVMMQMWGYAATYLAYDHEQHWLFKKPR